MPIPSDIDRRVRLAGRALDECALRSIYTFTLLYVVAYFLGVTGVGLDAARIGYDLDVLVL